jgi:hypothetical protein
VNRERQVLPSQRRVTAVIGVARRRLDADNRPAQQAPGFWAQKSSNCWASEPAGGGESELGLSSVPGALAPPLPVVPVVPELSVPPVPVALVPVLAVPVPVLVPVEPVPLGVAVAVGVPVGVAVALASPELCRLGSDGMVTLAGGPGTSS